MSTCISPICESDYDDDGDVDGKDLKHLQDAYGFILADWQYAADADPMKFDLVADDDLMKFAEDFGRIRCPIINSPLKTVGSRIVQIRMYIEMIFTSTKFMICSKDGPNLTNLRV
jgi:hypothetical protein